MQVFMSPQAFMVSVQAKHICLPTSCLLLYPSYLFYCLNQREDISFLNLFLFRLILPCSKHCNIYFPKYQWLLVWKFLGWYRTNVFLMLSICKRFLLPFFIVMGLQGDSPNGNGSLCRPYPIAAPSRLCCLISPWLPFSITKHFLPLNIYARLFALRSISLHFLRLNLT